MVSRAAARPAAHSDSNFVAVHRKGLGQFTPDLHSILSIDAFLFDLTGKLAKRDCRGSHGSSYLFSRGNAIL